MCGSSSDQDDRWLEPTGCAFGVTISSGCAFGVTISSGCAFGLMISSG